MQLQHLHKRWFWIADSHTAGDGITQCVGGEQKLLLFKKHTYSS